MTQRANIKCGTCAQVLAVDPGAAGKQVQCPKCQSRLVVPAGLAPSGPAKTRQPSVASGSKSVAGPTPSPGPSSKRDVGALDRQKSSAGTRTQKSVPSQSKTASSSAEKSEGTTTVSCGQCQTKLAVKLLAQPSKVKCPKCQSQLKLPAKKPLSTSASNSGSVAPPAPESQSPSANQQPVVRDAIILNAGSPAPVAAAQPGFATTSPAPAEPAFGEPNFGGSSEPQHAGFPPAAASQDFGGVDLGATTQQPGFSNQSNPGQPYPASQNASQAGGGNGFIKWVNQHRFITGILSLNAFAFLVGIFNLPLLIMAAIQAPIAILIIVLLFIPRKHIIDKFATSFGQQFAGMGAGGAALVIVAIIARSVLRGARNQARREGEVDWSSWLDPSSIGAMVGSLIGLLVFAGIFFYLWKLFGIARVLATGYLAEMTFITMVMIVGGLAKAEREAESREFFENADRQHQEFMERTQQRHEEVRRRHEELRSRAFGPSGGPIPFEPSR